MDAAFVVTVGCLVLVSFPSMMMSVRVTLRSIEPSSLREAGCTRALSKAIPMRPASLRGMKEPSETPRQFPHYQHKNQKHQTNMVIEKQYQLFATVIVDSIWQPLLEFKQQHSTAVLRQYYYCCEV
mmetsp:Transcript_35497/g.40519  ORF Transcript_35497/g.40519 Transcript_35497/m.40519 type:complete len:126 (-) Transcript_35497:1972-2349(-)